MTQDALIDGRTARRDRNRRAVLDAVLDLFAAGDLSPSPEAVAHRSGLSLRSVYRYVADSEDLVQSAIERHLERVGPLFALAEPGKGPFQARVEAFVAARMRLYEAVAPTARAAHLRAQFGRTPASAIIGENLAARRRLLRTQLERQFPLRWRVHIRSGPRGPGDRAAQAARPGCLRQGAPAPDSATAERSHEAARRLRRRDRPDHRRVGAVLAGPAASGARRPQRRGDPARRHRLRVSDQYESPFAFEDTLDRVDIQIVSARDAAAEAATADAIARAEMSRQ